MRLMFGLSRSPLVFKGTIKHHLEWYEQDQPQTVLELKQSMYLDDVIGRGDNMESTKVFKENIVKISMKLASSYINGTPMLQNWRKRKTTHK